MSRYVKLAICGAAGWIALAGCQPMRTMDNGGPNDNGAPAGPLGQAGGVVTFTLPDGHVYRIDARAGATPEDVTEGLDQLGARAVDEWLNVSPNGDWLLVSTERFDEACAGFACLAIVDSALTGAEVIRADGEVVHAPSFSAVASSGDLVVYPAGGGPHERDLWAVRREGDGWSAPELLTGQSPHPFNRLPAISDDGSQVVFDCGPDPFGQAGTGICQVATVGGAVTQVLRPEDNPPGQPAGTALHSPDFAPDGSIVFEADWGGERLWRLPAGGGTPVLIAPADDNDNSPCVLPDGRAVSLWLARPGGPGLHEIKAVDTGDGGQELILTGQDVQDIGIGCGGSGSGSGGQAARDRYFPEGAVWNQDISDATLDAQSDEIIAWLENAGGWGLGRMQIDFSIEVLQADAATPFVGWTPTEDWFEPDCDLDDVPLPAGGALEGESGYECSSDGDCHLIVVHDPSNRLFEMWRADMENGALFGGCLAVWDLTRVYPPSGRGENCTSADAAGLPIAPLLFTADEVATGSIEHAIRFILPNERIREDVYVHPATHSTPATSGPESAPPYGVRFRLRADYPLESLPNEGARVVARAMQKYGMFLADAGRVALTAQSDRFTSAKWEGLLDSRELDQFEVSDFEVVEAGERIAYTGDCVREP